MAKRKLIRGVKQGQYSTYEKKYSDEFYMNYNKRSKKSIMAEIRYTSREISYRLVKTKKKDPKVLENAFVKEGVQRLNTFSGRKTVNMEIIPVGSYSRNKNELIRQARELKSFKNWDFYTEEGKAALKGRAKQAYESFIENRPVDEEAGEKQITMQEWEDMVETFGSLGYDVMKDLESNEVVSAYEISTKAGNETRFVDIYNDLAKYYKSGNKTIPEAKAGTPLEPGDTKVKTHFIKDFKMYLLDENGYTTLHELVQGMK